MDCFLFADSSAEQKLEDICFLPVASGEKVPQILRAVSLDGLLRISDLIRFEQRPLAFEMEERGFQVRQVIRNGPGRHVLVAKHPDVPEDVLGAAFRSVSLYAM